MLSNKLTELIQRKNERLEEEATQTATELIEKIVELQAAKTEADRQITELREQLKKIEVRSIDAATILG